MPRSTNHLADVEPSTAARDLRKVYQEVRAARPPIVDPHLDYREWFVR